MVSACKKVKFMLFELFKVCKKLNRRIFLCRPRSVRKAPPRKKKFFHQKKVKYLILNYERVFNDVYSHFRINILIIFEHILGFQYEQGNFLQKREKSTPSSTFFWPFSKKFQKTSKIIFFHKSMWVPQNIYTVLRLWHKLFWRLGVFIEV